MEAGDPFSVAEQADLSVLARFSTAFLVDMHHNGGLAHDKRPTYTRIPHGTGTSQDAHVLMTKNQSVRL